MAIICIGNPEELKFILEVEKDRMREAKINNDEWGIPRDALNASDFKLQLRKEIAEECSESIDEAIEIRLKDDVSPQDKYNVLSDVLEIIRGDQG